MAKADWQEPFELWFDDEWNGLPYPGTKQGAYDLALQAYPAGWEAGSASERQRIRERATRLQAEGKLTVAPLSQLLADLIDES